MGRKRSHGMIRVLSRPKSRRCTTPVQTKSKIRLILGLTLSVVGMILVIISLMGIIR